MPPAPAPPRLLMRPGHSAAGKWTFACGVTLGVAGAALLALSFLSYERLVAHVDAFTVDRDADVSRAEFDDVVARMRILAAATAVLAAALTALAERIGRVVGEVARSWWLSTRSAPALLRSWAMSEERAYIASGGVILVAAVALRIAFLDVPLRYDEATTYNNFVSQPLHAALANYATPNNHLFHTFLAKIAAAVLGNELWAIRLPALAAGVALVPATFALGRMLYGRSAALLAAAFVAASSTLVEYSTNARGYTIVALLTIVAFLAAAHALERDSTGAWALVAVAGALGLYAVPVMIYPLGGVFVWLVASAWISGRPFRPLLVRLGAAALATAILTLVLYAPVYAASGVRSVTSNEFVEPQSLSTFLDLLPDHAWDTSESWTRDLPLVATIVLAVGFVAGLALAPRSRYPVSPVLAVLAWALPVLAVQRVVPFTRVWLFLLPLVAVTAAGAFGRLLEIRPAGARLGAPLAALFAGGAALAIVSADTVRESRETGALVDAPAVAAYLAGVVRADDRILATGSDTILEYYLERDGIEAGPLLYGDEPRKRTYVVVNTLGGQSVGDLIRQLDAPPGTVGPPEVLKRYPSAQVYLVRRLG